MSKLPEVKYKRLVAKRQENFLENITKAMYGDLSGYRKPTPKEIKNMEHVKHGYNKEIGYKKFEEIFTFEYSEIGLKYRYLEVNNNHLEWAIKNNWANYTSVYDHKVYIHNPFIGKRSLTIELPYYEYCGYDEAVNETLNAFCGDYIVYIPYFKTIHVIIENQWSSFNYQIEKPLEQKEIKVTGLIKKFGKKRKKTN